MEIYEEVCDIYNCFHNDDGFCNSVGDLRNNELGVDCPDYIIDDENMSLHPYGAWPNSNPHIENNKKLREYIANKMKEKENETK